MLALPQSQAGRILNEKGVELEAARRILMDLLGAASEEFTPSVDEFANPLLAKIYEELFRLEGAQDEAVKAADYEHAAELRDLREAAKERIVQALSGILEDLENAGRQENSGSS